MSFTPNSQLSSLHLVQGSAPKASDEVAIDAATADKYKFKVGERVEVLLAGPPQEFTISGIVRFGTATNLAGATIAAFDLPTAQRLFNRVGRYDAIDVLARPGAGKAQLQRAIAAVLPTGMEVVTGQTVANEQINYFGQTLSFFSTALEVFGFIALFMGGFTIFNTFSIIVGQRTRELALLRILGASRRQVFLSVLGEAAFVGLLASVADLGLGVLAARGLEALLGGFGVTLPSGGLVLQPRTIIVGLFVGVGVTVISAVNPARRAVHIPPVAAIAEVAIGAPVSSRRRTVAGSSILLLGILAFAIGLTAPAIQLVGAGALAIFIGAGMLAPLVARPMAGAIGSPLRALGISGKLGRLNSMRSPRRTAQTAAALTVGLALVSTIAVFGASLSRSTTASIDQAISADYIITNPGSGGAGEFSASAASAVGRAPGVTVVSSVLFGQFEFRNTLSTLIGVSPGQLSKTVILRITSGAGAPALAAGNLLIDITRANSDHLSVGSTVPVKFALTGSGSVRIGGIFKPNSLIGSLLASDQFFRTHFSDALPIAVLVRTTTPAGPPGKATLEARLRSYPGLQVQTEAEYVKSQQRQVNQLLGLVYALLALAVLIALIGIVNTLMLSVLERTHEIGLLRAVGMLCRQIRLMVRSEAMILAVFGAIIGVVIGTGLGVALSASLKQQGITDIAVPLSSLILFLVLAALLGLAAASAPARRAAKLDVLAAIAAQ